MSATLITPPLRRIRLRGARWPSIFLGGSIEMGEARDWQSEAVTALEDHAGLLYSPRRADWDSTWVQDIGNPDFNAQVHWEMDMIEKADYVLLHFEPDTKSPITLGELYWTLAKKPQCVVVSCPPDYWRHGNVAIMCEREGVKCHPSLPAALHTLKRLATEFALR